MGEQPPSTNDRPTWKRVGEECGDGVAVYEVAHWSAFYGFLDECVYHEARPARDFVWRGQRCTNWEIRSSLDRMFDELGLLNAENNPLMELLAEEHLDRFKYAVRGRRGFNPQRLDGADDWWSLAQHYGLKTPLLDWTRSPFAALFFAFEERGDGPDRTPCRAVYALERTWVRRANSRVDNADSLLERGRAPILDIIDPLTDENPRLVNQDGLFTRAPIGLGVEEWVRANFRDTAVEVLLKIRIPDNDRIACLRKMRRMNVHHLSLFPDLLGASQYTNLLLELEPLRAD